MELAILILLAQHGTLAFDQIVAEPDPASEVRRRLIDLREAGFADVFGVGELAGHPTTAAS